MQSKPKVSIIIAIYNVEKVINECVNSIVRQSYKNIECILVNDCSTDNTKSILEEFANKDKRITVINHSENKGLARTRRSGLEKATGEYIWQIDGDDFIEEFAVQFLVEIMIKDQCDIARAGYTFFTGKKRQSSGTEQWTVSSNNGLEFYEDLCSAPMGLVFNMFRASFVSKVEIPGHNNINLGEDFVFNSHMYSKTNKISVSNKTIYNYRRETGSYTTGKLENRRFLEESMAHKVVYKNWEKIPLARDIFSIKMTHFRIGKIEEVVRLKEKNYALETIKNYKFIYSEIPPKVIYRDISKIIDIKGWSPKANKRIFNVAEMLHSSSVNDIYNYVKNMQEE